MPALRVLCSMSLLGLACGGTSSPPATAAATADVDGCAGAAIDVDRAQQACATEAADSPVPPAAALELALADVDVTSGQATELIVTARNRSGQPMALVLSPVCSFGVTVYDQQGQIADEEGPPAALAGCLAVVGTSIAITLPPDGVLTKRVPWTARKIRQACTDDTCADAPGAPIAPGVYRVEVATPFSDPVDGSEHHRRPRMVSARLGISASR